MKGVLAGLILFPLIAIAVLSIRPGGLRQQLRAARRRLKIALALAGVYLVGSLLVRLLAADRSWADFAIYGLAAVLALVFVFLSFDREQPEPRR